MAFALNFDQRLKRTLKQLVPEYEWVLGWHADGRSRVDVAGLTTHGVPSVLVEVELKKDNPVENVVKIWRWATAKKIRSQILFLQAFSAHYLNVGVSASHPAKGKQYERAVFIGERMKKDRTLRIRYKAIPIHTTTHKGKLKQFKPLQRRGVTVKAGGDAMLRAAENLAHKIKKALHAQSNR